MVSTATVKKKMRWPWWSCTSKVLKCSETPGDISVRIHHRRLNRHPKDSALLRPSEMYLVATNRTVKLIWALPDPQSH